MDEKSSQRNQSLDVLRVVMMLFIVTHHCIVSGLGLNDLMNQVGAFVLDSKTIILQMMNSFVVIAVNVYFLISGYFGIKLKFEKIIRLYVQIAFYAITIYILLSVLGIVKLSFGGIIRYSIVSCEMYWYMIVYFALMIISPALNKLADAWSDDTGAFLGFLMLLSVLICGYGFVTENRYIGTNQGYSLLNAAYLYLWGRFIKKRGKIFSKPSTHFLEYGICGFLNGGVLILCVIGKNIAAWKLYSYNNPVLVLESLCVFCAFINIKGEGKVFRCISKLSPYTLGVYLIHSMPLLIPYRFLFLDRFLVDAHWIIYLFAVILYSTVLFFICIFIEFLRCKFFEYAKIDHTISLVSMKVKKLLKK